MKPSIIKAGSCTAVTAAVTMTLFGLLPTTAQAAPAAPDITNKLAGKTVFLDPGHQGPKHSEDLARQVSDGRGGTKDCQTTGMTTVNGIPEHTINWNVAQLVKASLESLGARVVLSRQDDTGWGGCIDERARAANESGAAVAVSIHADSAPAEYRGFHLIIPRLPIPDGTVNQIQAGAGYAASKSVRDAYLHAGFPSANYAGVADGLQTRKDIAGPALTAVPAVFVEMGNGANPEDAALLESQEGQLKHAIAITTGLVGYVLGAPQTGSSSDRPAVIPGAAGSGVPSDRPAVVLSAPQDQTAARAPQGVPGALPGQAVPSEPQARIVPDVPPSQAVPGEPQARIIPLPGQIVPGAPQSQAVPGAPQSQAVPGAPQWTGPQGSVGGKVVELLMPLARSLGIDATAITPELVNLADTLLGMLNGPSK
ncbi:N-acetylmuramoyl-L-alanine amidase [Nocardia sp. NBC_01730]|uniref:N-acetylmuramoyl-L-alanine amidase n=1 Tax=Nocardia sp. NBC_01730 TaxID=2975998 RepID=UPI002E14E306|nr:N-acetylmuramoyl-L-alanine amidase [Nocardia sp. NBC_01730]